MINIPMETIIQKITEQTELGEEEVQKKIDAKLEHLSGLISKEGAAHIVANELGVKLMQTEGVLKIENLMVGMRDVELNCKVIRKYDLRTFENAKGQGKVFKFLVGDDSGVTMVVLWNDKADLEKDFKEGDVLKLKQVNVRDNNGRTEIHLGEGSDIEVNPEGVELETKQGFSKPERKKISELTEKDQNVELFATVVQVFDPKFFKVNAEGKRIREDENPDGATYGSVLNIFVDDGSDNIRVVLWKNQIINFLNVSEEELLKFREDPASFDEYKNKMLGEMMKFIGRTTKNEMFGKTEFVANVVLSDVDPKEEINKLESEEPKEKSPEKKSDEESKSKPAEETKKEEPAEKEKSEETKKKSSEDDDLLSLEDIEDIEEDI